MFVQETFNDVYLFTSSYVIIHEHNDDKKFKRQSTNDFIRADISLSQANTPSSRGFDIKSVSNIKQWKINTKFPYDLIEEAEYKNISNDPIMNMRLTSNGQWLIAIDYNSVLSIFDIHEKTNDPIQ